MRGLYSQSGAHNVRFLFFLLFPFFSSTSMEPDPKRVKASPGVSGSKMELQL